jgi:bacteriocin biosynthesis cyclodehydratase domain-containing protein
LRLARTVEVFEASDGDVYVLRGGADAKFTLEAHDAAARELLRRLAGDGGGVDELAAGCDRPAAEVGAALAELDGLGLLERAGDRDAALLGPEALERFDRQLAYFADMRPGAASQMQARLAAAHVAVIGVGGLGTWAASALACAGVGTLTLVDDDRVALSNLNRQVLYRRADVGRPKVEVAAAALTAFNPACDVRARAGRVAGPDDVAAVAAGADLIVDTADWPPYDIGRWINRAALALGVPWIAAAQFPPFVRVGPLYIPGETACLECQERAGRRMYPLYDELADFRRARESYAATLGPASGLVGSAIGMEALHLLTGAATPASAGAALILDLRTLESRREPVASDPECPECGPGSGGQRARQLPARADAQLGEDPVQVRAHGAV